MCNFRVGQKVVCVNDGLHPQTGKATSVKAGTVYTVSGVARNNDCHGYGGIAIREADPVHHIMFFAAWRFRPLAERKTDISQLQRMLTDTKVEERA